MKAIKVVLMLRPLALASLGMTPLVARPAVAAKPVTAIAFQDFDTEPDGGVLQADVLSGVATQDSIFSPADITPVGQVDFNYYATGESSR